MRKINQSGYFEFWVILEDGQLTPFKEQCGIGLVHDLNFLDVCEISEKECGELRAMAEDIQLNPPEGAIEAIFKVFDINYDEGEADEHGRYYCKPGYYYSMEFLRYE